MLLSAKRCFALGCLLSIPAAVCADDWLQFRGPGATALSTVPEHFTEHRILSASLRSRRESSGPPNARVDSDVQSQPTGWSDSIGAGGP